MPQFDTPLVGTCEYARHSTVPHRRTDECNDWLPSAMESFSEFIARMKRELGESYIVTRLNGPT